MKGYEAYTYYETHPQEAVLAYFDDTSNNDDNSWSYSILYRDYWLHKSIMPFTDMDLLSKLNEARAAGDAEQWWIIASMIVLGEGLESDFSGAGSLSWKNAWYSTNFDTIDQAITYHFESHLGPWKTEEQYTRAAQGFWQRNSNRARETILSNGEPGLRIVGGKYFGIYTQDGHIVTFGLNNR